MKYAGGHCEHRFEEEKRCNGKGETLGELEEVKRLGETLPRS